LTGTIQSATALPPAADAGSRRSPARPARHIRVFERPQGGDRALLVALDFGDADPAERMAELDALAVSAGATVVGTVTGRRQHPDAATYAGKGKVEEVAAKRAESEADLVIFNHTLTGAQQRNLERRLECRVVDRTSLILDIFALRARSAEGKLQVELAQVKHQLTRLVGGWTHLERQKGGIGLRGPWRKAARNRPAAARRAGRGAEGTALPCRAPARHARPHPTPGGRAHRGARRLHQRRKSTLFNRMTGAKAYAADQLFATLDTTLRRVYVPDASPIVLSDTVGFIRELPHDLVAAFRATLATAAEADLLLHVIDAAHPCRDEQAAAVDAVLLEIGAERVPQIRVMNKIDAAGLSAGIERDQSGIISRVRLSALTGAGCADLRAALAERFPADVPFSGVSAAPVLDA
jgi:GTP-binding protein HflX